MTDPDVLHLARLARLRLTEEEAARMARDLGSILPHLAALRRVPPLAGDPSAAAARAPTPLRPDVVAPDPLRRPPERIAPEWVDGFFVVPRLASHAGDEGEP